MNPGGDAPKPPSAAETSGGKRSTDEQLSSRSLLFDFSEGWNDVVFKFGDNSPPKRMKLSTEMEKPLPPPPYLQNSIQQNSIIKDGGNSKLPDQMKMSSMQDLNWDLNSKLNSFMSMQQQQQLQQMNSMQNLNSLGSIQQQQLQAAKMNSNSNSRHNMRPLSRAATTQLNQRLPSPSNTNINNLSLPEKEEEDKGTATTNSGPMLKDFGGIDEVIDELTRKVLVPFRHPRMQRRAGTSPITGILLKGPPGCGKTTLARAIANEARVPLHQVSAPELMDSYYGKSEKLIRELFSKAIKGAPSVVFIDEIDSISAKRGRNNHSGFVDRITTQLMTSMDEAHKLVKEQDETKNGYVLVIGATNRPDNIDPALRRPGRFDREFYLGVPDESSRAQILSRLTSNVQVEGDFDVGKIAKSTPGFAGADLESLVDEASNLAIVRVLEKRKINDECRDYWKAPSSDEEVESVVITMADIEAAAKIVTPSTKREGFSEIPNVKWDDVGGLQSLRQEFELHIVRRIKSPQDYVDFGIDLQTGFLLYGPPGCGKTLIAKAVASEAGANFIYIKGPELLTSLYGESEQAVRTLFSRARTCTPCILFFDEVDALTTNSGKDRGCNYEGIVKQLLIELDGAEQRKGVYVIGATNRPDAMDRAMLRPGRFGKLVYVPLPSPDERGMILKSLARNKPIHAGVDLMALGRDTRCHNLSGADLSALMNEAAMAALVDKQSLSSDTSCSEPCTIREVHFVTALTKVSPSVSDEQIQHYNSLYGKLKS